MLFQPSKPVHFDGFERAADLLSVILAAKVTCSRPRGSSRGRLCSAASQVFQQGCAVYNWRAGLHLSVNETALIIFVAKKTAAPLMLVQQVKSSRHHRVSQAYSAPILLQCLHLIKEIPFYLLCI